MLFRDQEQLIAHCRYFFLQHLDADVPDVQLKLKALKPASDRVENNPSYFDAKLYEEGYDRIRFWSRCESWICGNAPDPGFPIVKGNELFGSDLIRDLCQLKESYSYFISDFGLDVPWIRYVLFLFLQNFHNLRLSPSLSDWCPRDKLVESEFRSERLPVLFIHESWDLHGEDSEEFMLRMGREFDEYLENFLLIDREHLSRRLPVLFNHKGWDYKNECPDEFTSRIKCDFNVYLEAFIGSAIDGARDHGLRSDRGRSFDYSRVQWMVRWSVQKKTMQKIADEFHVTLEAVRGARKTFERLGLPNPKR